MITRWFVYTKGAGSKRFRHIAVFDTRDKAIECAMELFPSYIQGTNDCGSEETEKIFINR